MALAPARSTPRTARRSAEIRLAADTQLNVARTLIFLPPEEA